jgi:type I restriction enzyme S subunit
MKDSSNIPKYDDYQDSGVEWLGAIPMGWYTERSQWLFQQRRERARKGDLQLTASQKYGMISQKKYMELEGKRVTQVQFNAEILKHVEADDFVISMRSFQGGIEYCQEKGCVSSAYVPLIPSKYVYSPFFKYLLKCQRYIEALQSTSNLVRDGQALRYENFRMVDLPIIPIKEQTTISIFLDKKTTQIDGAIAIKQKQISLLKEREQIMIQQAITKGLNPDVQMYDSGVKWLGEIPSHWKVERSQWLFKQRKERARLSDEQLTASQKHGVISQQKYMEIEGKRVTQVEFNAGILKHVEENDFVISMRSFQGGIEYCPYVGCVSSAYVPLIPGDKVYSPYFKYLLKSQRYIEALQSTSNLVRDGQALRYNNFCMLDLPIVPMDEQRELTAA